MNISVYITSYNQKSYLKEAVESVLGQTFQPYEVILVDDCSTDGSQDYINSICEKHPDLIKKHFNSKNLGITKTRNIALSLVKGEYLTWLDGDDIFKPKKLEIESGLLKKTNSDLVYSNFYYSYEHINDIYQIWCSSINQLPKESNVFKEVIAREFPRNTLFRSELFNVKLLKHSGDYDENLEIYEDFDFRIRLSENAKTAFTIEPLSVYRKHSEGLSRAKVEVHKKCLDYIFKKNESKILNLETNERLKIQNSILGYMNKFDSDKNNLKKTIKFKEKLKNKLISLIKRF